MTQALVADGKMGTTRRVIGKSGRINARIWHPRSATSTNRLSLSAGSEVATRNSKSIALTWPVSVQRPESEAAARSNFRARAATRNDINRHEHSEPMNDVTGSGPSSASAELAHSNEPWRTRVRSPSPSNSTATWRFANACAGTFAGTPKNSAASSNCLILTVKRAAVAPSIPRWS
jgi:hypothetical protein